MNDLNKNFEQNIKEIFKELKTEPVVNKVYLSKITFFNGGISLILFIIGFVLIYFSIINRDSLEEFSICLLYTSPSPRDAHESRMTSSA